MLKSIYKPCNRRPTWLSFETEQLLPKRQLGFYLALTFPLEDINALTAYSTVWWISVITFCTRHFPGTILARKKVTIFTVGRSPVAGEIKRLFRHCQKMYPKKTWLWPIFPHTADISRGISLLGVCLMIFLEMWESYVYIWNVAWLILKIFRPAQRVFLRSRRCCHKIQISSGRFLKIVAWLILLREREIR